MPNPSEWNLLQSHQFKLDIWSLPETTYWIQTTFLPSVTLESSLLPAPTRDIPIPGHKLEFENLTATFIVDQDLKNFEEIFNWMVRIGTEEATEDMLSDMTLHFLTGNMNISRSIIFANAYPTTLTELSVQSDDTDAIQVLGNVIFSYSHYTFENGIESYTIS